MSNITVIDLVQQQEQLFLPVISDNAVTWESEKQFAIQALQGNKFLSDTALKNQASLQNAIINGSNSPVLSSVLVAASASAPDVVSAAPS